MQVSQEEFLTLVVTTGGNTAVASARVSMAVELLRRRGQVQFRALGSSMMPSIWPTDIVQVKQCTLEEACVGDVVVFVRHERLFVHRIIKRESDHLVTQGDALVTPDAQVCAIDLLGKVIAIKRKGGQVSGPFRLTRFRRMTSAVVRRSEFTRRVLARLNSFRAGTVP